MATTQVVKVLVETLTPYGFKSNGKYVNYSKQLSAEDKAKVVPGAAFDAEYYISDGGKEYLNKVLSAPVQATESKAEKKTFKPKFEKKADADKMSKSEWQAKDRSQLIGGLSHDAATVVAAMLAVAHYPTTVEVLTEYKVLLEGMLKIRDQIN
jgi:hypothetical protein